MTGLTRRQIALMLGAAPYLALGRAAFAQQEWPNKVITYVVPYPPGGTTDVLGRLIAAKLAPALKATMVVENKSGATGTIGTQAVARAAPDGYTLLGTSTGPQSIVPNLNPKLGYDPEKSFAPIILIGTIPSVLIVGGNSPFRSMDDIVQAAKKDPGNITYASGGIGTILHISGELLQLKAGIKLLHVPYRGDTPAIQDVVAGNVAMMFAPTTPIVSHIKSGTLRAIAVASAQRLKGLPDVPTTAEVGLKDAEAEQWQAVYAPAGTPADIVERLNKEINQLLGEPETVTLLDQLGVTPLGGSPQRLGDWQKAELAKWRDVIAQANVKVE